MTTPSEPDAWMWMHPQHTGGKWCQCGPMSEHNTEGAKYLPFYATPPVVGEAVKAEREACAQQVFEYLAETISANDGNRQLMIEAGLPVNETDRRGHLLRTIRDDLSDAIRARSATP